MPHRTPANLARRLVGTTLAVTVLIGVSGLGPASPALAAPAPRCPLTEPPAPTGSTAPTPSPPAQARIDPDTTPVGGPRLRGGSLVAPRPAPPLPDGLTARGWVLADLDTGAVVAACAPHDIYAPASVQKLLTLLAVLPRVDPRQSVTVTAEDLDFEPGSSAVGLVKDGVYSVETLVLGLLLVSGNDAANVLARVAGGEHGIAGTVREMNAVAQHLGARDTHAVTPSGLDADDQRTSAYDLALIARAAFARDDFRRYVTTARADIPAQPPNHPGFQIQNDNKLLTRYPGGLGGKTGFTDIARHTFVGFAEHDTPRGKRRLVVTMLYGEHRPVPLWQQAASLLDWGFALSADTTAVGHLVEPGDPVPTPSRHPTAAPAHAAPRERTGDRYLMAGAAALALTVVGLCAAAVRQHGRTPSATSVPVSAPPRRSRSWR